MLKFTVTAKNNEAKIRIDSIAGGTAKGWTGQELTWSFKNLELDLSIDEAYDLLAVLSAELEAAYGVEEEITEGYVQTS